MAQIFFETIFWLSFLTLFYTYLGYPAILFLAASLSKSPANKEPENWPNVSVILSVHNEESSISRKIENLLSLEYPGGNKEVIVGSDGSTDGTASVLMGVSKDNLKCFVYGERKGKANTISRLVTKAKGEILFFVDARQEIDRNALQNIVRNFSDKKVGCVSGELVFRNDGTTPMSQGVDFYWRYEKFLRGKESRIYSITGVTGAIYAIRKDLFVPPPEEILLDDVFVPLKVMEKGYRVLFDATAKAYDIPAQSASQEFTRKVRTIAGNFQIFRMYPEFINPFHSKIGFQLISHKLMRAISFIPLVILFFSNIALLRVRSYMLTMVFQTVFYALALAGRFAENKNVKIRLISIPYAFCVLNIAALNGFIVFISGRIDTRWKKAGSL